MPLSRRYTPEHPPQDSCLYGMDFSYLLPPGVGISWVSLDIQRNIQPPVEASSDFTIGPPFILDRAVYATLRGGVEGNDYQLRWLIQDSEGNNWQRTGLILCAQTS
jgi:hypothetical protein